MPRKEARPKAKRPKPKIESQELIAETGRRAYEMLRLTRVKYQDNPYVFLDLRLFQRGYDYTTDKDVFILREREFSLKRKTFND